MKQSQFYYLLRRGLFSAGSAIIKNGLVMFNKFTTAGISHPAQGSAEFNGSSDYIDTAEMPLTEFENFTISGWAYFDNIGTTRVLLAFGNSTSNTPIIVMEAQSSGLARFFVRDLSSSYAQVDSSTGLVTSGKWYFFTGTRNGNDFKGYLDGSLYASVTTSSIDIEGDLNIFSIGRLSRLTPSGYMNGNLANVAIWNRALSSDEINSVMWKSYEALSGTESNGLKAWYSLDDITSPAASLANMQQLATDKNATIENTAAITAAINSLS